MTADITSTQAGSGAGRSAWGKSSTAAAGAGLPADFEATQAGEAVLSPHS